MMKKLLFTASFLAILLPFQSALSRDHAISSYAGEETRAIKSLSEADLAELRRGGGWGMAKAAELNGVPGPAHLLELKNEIHLNDAQINDIERIHDSMRTAAIAEGKRLIALEREISDRFRRGEMDEERLRTLLAASAQHRSRLRYIHLSSHLRTPEVLTAAQVARYNALRGYGADGCPGHSPRHDAERRQAHKGCD